MAVLPKDLNGNPLQVFSPSELLIGQTTLDVTDKQDVALLPADACKVKFDGGPTFATWPYGCAIGLANINTIEFETATDVYVME